MATAIKLEKFEGPLDLLLQLIDEEQMPITEVSLSALTEQYMAYLAELEDRSEELADFLVTATRLLYLKSRILLPYLYPAEEEQGPGLAEQLKLYKQFVEASKKVHGLWQHLAISYGRVEPPVKMKEFTVPPNATAEALRVSFYNLLKRLKPVNPLPEVKIDRTLSVRQKIESIFSTLQQLKKMSFKQMISDSESKTEVIVSFLALLELLKQDKIVIRQDESFEDMTFSVA